MRKSFKSLSGVTLLEIMLVLAIAALIIVMSIRFYQSAADANKVNAGMSTIQGVVAAGENAFTAGASGTTMQTDILPYLPKNAMPSSPWGGDVSVAPGSASSYTITMSSPGTDAASPCGKLKSFLEQNSKFTGITCTGSDINLTVTS